jgi:5-(aminomethyl)-3-furanmethanol phosphate kinase
MNEPPVVVKVGGSLYDLPDLANRLRRRLSVLAEPRVLLVPGGGPTADVVRGFDRRHRLGEEASHWLALRALTVNAHFLACLLPEAEVVATVGQGGRWCVLEPHAFFRADERRADHWPHRWDVTSDSLAVRVALLAGARELILLKSAAWTVDGEWSQAARAGVVDGFFAEALRRAGSLRIRVVNLRADASG